MTKHLPGPDFIVVHGVNAFTLIAGDGTPLMATVPTLERVEAVLAHHLTLCRRMGRTAIVDDFDADTCSSTRRPAP
jgi:hypothetical protein